MASRDAKKTPTAHQRETSTVRDRKGESASAHHKGKSLVRKTSSKDSTKVDKSRSSVNSSVVRPRSMDDRVGADGVSGIKKSVMSGQRTEDRTAASRSKVHTATRSDTEKSVGKGLAVDGHGQESRKPARTVNYSRINELAEPKGGRKGTPESRKASNRSAALSTSSSAGERVVIRREELGLKNALVGSTRRQKLLAEDIGGLRADDTEDTSLHRAKARGHSQHSLRADEYEAAVTLTRLSATTGRFESTEREGSLASTPKSAIKRSYGTGLSGGSSSSTRLLPKRPRIGESSGASDHRLRGAGLILRENPYRQPASAPGRESAVGRSGGRAHGHQASGIGRPPIAAPPSLSVTVRELKAMRDDQPVTRTVKVMVVRLQDGMMRNPLVHKNRRKMVVADSTGCMIAYIKRSLPIKFGEGHCILLCNIRARQSLLTIHDKTTITRVGNVTVSTDIQEAACALFDRPTTAPSSISEIVSRGPGHIVSLVARVTQSEDSRLIIDREKKQKYVKEVTLQQAATTIKMSLWDASAAYATFTVGDTLQVNDVSTVWSNHHRAAALTCNFADQIVVLPSTVMEEEIVILGLEESNSLDDLECTVEVNNTIAHYLINRYQLTNRLNTAQEQNVEDLVGFLPITAVAVVTGQVITEIEVHSFSEQVVYRNGGELDGPFRVPQCENAEDIFADGRQVFTEDGSGEIEPPLGSDSSELDDHFSVESAILNEETDGSEDGEETPMDCTEEDRSSVASEGLDSNLLLDSGDEQTTDLAEGGLRGAARCTEGDNDSTDSTVDYTAGDGGTDDADQPLSPGGRRAGNVTIAQIDAALDAHIGPAEDDLPLPEGGNQLSMTSPNLSVTGEVQLRDPVDGNSDSVVVIDGSSTTSAGLER